ncbi:MAG TPA: hypothetical protein VEU94_09450 [Terriglobales bacterium]|jgi:hypothetical protein|nr:hypothetical protein [Terriglobales bacterium]
MLSKCANPGCPAPFLYLHQGKLFRLDTCAEHPAAQSPAVQSKTVRHLEFFWLCEECAAKLTLDYKKGVGITTVSRSETRRETQSRAASAP